MKPRLNTWNINILGKWNIDILNPEWVALNIVKSNEIDVDIVLDGMTTNIRYNFEHLTFVPKPGRVVIAARSSSEEALASVEDAAKALLTALPVTPIGAAGINFAYDEANPPSEMLRNFGIGDSSRLADLGLTAVSTSIRRELFFEDIKLNFILTLLDGGSVRMGTNYHLEAESPQALAEMLSGRMFRYQDHSQSILSEIYNLNLEEEDA